MTSNLLDSLSYKDPAPVAIGSNTVETGRLAGRYFVDVYGVDNAAKWLAIMNAHLEPSQKNEEVSSVSKSTASRGASVTSPIVLETPSLAQVVPQKKEDDTDTRQNGDATATRPNSGEPIQAPQELSGESHESSDALLPGSYVNQEAQKGVKRGSVNEEREQTYLDLDDKVTEDVGRCPADSPTDWDEVDDMIESE